MIMNKKWTHHGKEGTPIYVSWASMKKRCRGTGGKSSIKYYKDIGITYCKRWEYFLNFYEDM